MVDLKDRALWQDVVLELERRIGSGVVDLWIREAAIVDATRDEVSIAVPTRFARDRIEARLTEPLADAFKALIGARPAIKVEVDPRLGPLEVGLRRPEAPAAAPASALAPGAAPAPASASGPAPATPPARALARRADRAARGGGRLNDRMTLESLVLGACNKIACRAAEQVCEAPGEELNPLVVTGPAGVGKTHLLTAIALKLKAEDGGRSVVFATAEDFANQYSAGVRASDTGRFRERYRDADAVVIDDIQLLATKEKTQLEVLHTFEALLNAGKQIVVSCDVSPKKMAGLHSGLRGRLLAGLVVDLEAPDLETRRRILEALARRSGMCLTREVSDFVARNLCRSVRDLEAAVTRLKAHAAIGARIDVALARRQLADLVGERAHGSREDLILEVVAGRCDVPSADIRGGSRRHGIARARQIAIFLMRRIMRATLTEVGRYFGREPSTVAFAEARVAELVVQDDSVSRIVEDCRAAFQDRA